ncbi:hypothetical protein HMPREF9137_0191 [Prevotella denticola F0289]|nr:hypothetical protein HMPREF9137_0191 [Prevotella denticola F0289]
MVAKPALIPLVSKAGRSGRKQMENSSECKDISPPAYPSW